MATPVRISEFRLPLTPSISQISIANIRRQAAPKKIQNRFVELLLLWIQIKSTIPLTTPTFLCAMALPL
jgi:hypothetical protein